MGDKTLILVNSEYLHVVYIAGMSGNLALTTFVYVETKDNTTKVLYKVVNWNKRLSRLDKVFTDYTKANDYYMKLSNKFSKKI